MKNKTLIVLSILLTFALILCGNVFSQNNKLKVSDAYEGNNVSIMYKSTLTYPILPSYMPDPAGTIPGLTSFWDYVTNGANMRKLWVIGDTVIVAADVIGDSASAQTGTARRMSYQVSYNGGSTWMATPIEVKNVGTAYPCMCPLFILGSRSVVFTGREYEGSSSRGFAGPELLLGGGVITTYLVPFSGRDYFGWTLNNNTISGIFQTGDTVNYAKFNLQTNSFEGLIKLAEPPTSVDASARCYITANENGQRIFAMWWKSTTGSIQMYGKEAIDGVFGSLQTVMPYGYIINGDSTSAWFGADVIYKPNSNTVCAAFNTLAPGNFGTREGSKLLFWSPGINGGNPTCIADRTSPTIPLLYDSNVYNNNRNLIQVGMTMVSHPSLAYSSTGNRLFCVFSACQPDTSSYGYHFNDIYVSYSDNDGLTWSIPKNITNTPIHDEIYPTISKTGNTNTLIKITYSYSDFPGSTSFTNTTTPISRNYQIYTTVNPVGINNISNEVPAQFKLHQNYPNPFNPVTKIRFEIQKTSNVSLKVYNAAGQLVATLFNNETLSPGVKEYEFNASGLSSGIYFYTMKAGDMKETKKMILVK